MKTKQRTTAPNILFCTSVINYYFMGPVVQKHFSPGGSSPLPNLLENKKAITTMQILRQNKQYCLDIALKPQGQQILKQRGSCRQFVTTKQFHLISYYIMRKHFGPDQCTGIPGSKCITKFNFFIHLFL